MTGMLMSPLVILKSVNFLISENLPHGHFLILGEISSIRQLLNICFSQFHCNVLSVSIKCRLQTRYKI